MTNKSNTVDINNSCDEIKSLILELRNIIIGSSDNNTQLTAIAESLDNIKSMLNLSDGELDFKKLDKLTKSASTALSDIQENINKELFDNLNQSLKVLTEKLNRLEILANNTGIDEQVILNMVNSAEQSLSNKLQDSVGQLAAENASHAEMLNTGFTEVNENLRDCTQYLEKSLKAVSDDAVQHLTDDLTILGTSVEKTTTNLKHSIIDIFSRIQEDITNKLSQRKEEEKQEIAVNDYSEDFEMLKTGICNLDINTGKKISEINNLIEELDLFQKLEQFAKLKDLPAIGDLKSSLETKLNRIVEDYAYTLQSSQNRDELNKTTLQFKKDVYNEILMLLSRASEFLTEDDQPNNDELEIKNNQIEELKEQIDELVAVTELNNSGYDNIQIELKDIREKNLDILDIIQANSKKLTAKKTSMEESLFEIKNNVVDIQTKGETLKKQTSEISEVIKECTKSIIEHDIPINENIKNLLVDIKKNILILQSGDEESDYAYSMQDIESDVAKIRIYLNELSQNGVSVNTQEFSDELNNIVIMVDSMKQQLNKIDECDISDAISKIKEDMTSVSTRVNKLLLTSDTSYNIIESAMKDFRLLSNDIDEQLKLMANTSKYKALEQNIADIKSKFIENSNYTSMINDSLVMLAEWVDNAGETITEINEKQDKLESLDKLLDIAVETKNNIEIESEKLSLTMTNLIKDIPQPADYMDILDSIKNSISKQDERISKLDEKLTTALEISAKNDYGELSAKIDDINEKLEKLNKSIERITSYVNED